MEYPIYLKGEGTKENPFLVTHNQFDEIISITNEGDRVYGMAPNEEEKQNIRNIYRNILLFRYPQLFDNASLKITYL